MRDWIYDRWLRERAYDGERARGIEIVLVGLVYDAVPPALDGFNGVFLAVGEREGCALSFVAYDHRANSNTA